MYSVGSVDFSFLIFPSTRHGSQPKFKQNRCWRRWEYRFKTNECCWRFEWATVFEVATLKWQQFRRQKGPKNNKEDEENNEMLQSKVARIIIEDQRASKQMRDKLNQIAGQESAEHTLTRGEEIEILCSVYSLMSEMMHCGVRHGGIKNTKKSTESFCRFCWRSIFCTIHCD